MEFHKALIGLNVCHVMNVNQSNIIDHCWPVVIEFANLTGRSETLYLLYKTQKSYFKKSVTESCSIEYMPRLLIIKFKWLSSSIRFVEVNHNNQLHAFKCFNFLRKDINAYFSFYSAIVRANYVWSHHYLSLNFGNLEVASWLAIELTAQRRLPLSTYSQQFSEFSG